MDNLTHTMVGAVLARTRLSRAGGGVTAVLLLASNLPDLEVFSVVTRGRLGYLESHRGPSHGPLGLVGLALAAAALVRWWPAGWPPKGRAPRRFWPLAGVALVATVVHVLLDFGTSYGTRVLSPFSAVWYGVDWMPIVEPYLLVILSIGALMSRLRPAAGARVAAITLALAAALYAGRGLLHEAAMRRAVLPSAPEDAAAPAGRAPPARPRPVFSYLWPARPPELPAALPTRWSPFRWNVVRAVPGGYELSELDLLRAAPRVPPVLHPRAQDAWVERAAAAPTPRVFVTFMRFPAIFVSRRPNGDVVVRWNDIRFAPAGRASGPDGSRPASHFGAWARLTAEGRLVAHGLGSG